MEFADFVSQKGYLAASVDAHRSALPFTGPIIFGRACRDLPGDVLKLTYESFIHLQN
jgi:hypothetical protein